MEKAAIDALVNEVVERWPEWEAEAGMDGQREQSSVAYTDTLRFRLREAISRHLVSGVLVFNYPPGDEKARQQAEEYAKGIGVNAVVIPRTAFDGTYPTTGDKVAVFGREGREGRPAGSTAE